MRTPWLVFHTCCWCPARAFCSLEGDGQAYGWWPPCAISGLCGISPVGWFPGGGAWNECWEGQAQDGKSCRNRTPSIISLWGLAEATPCWAMGVELPWGKGVVTFSLWLPGILSLQGPLGHLPLPVCPLVPTGMDLSSSSILFSWLEIPSPSRCAPISAQTPTTP